MCTLPILLALLTLPSTVFSQSTCSPESTRPLSIPIRNVTLASQVLRRGAALSIGTPPQDFAFEISGFANNTFIYDGSGMCPPDITPIQCAGLHGGSFNEGTSSTWSQAIGQNASGAAQEHPYVDATTDIWGSDLLQLNSSISVNNFPLAVTRTKAWQMNAMGLGRNSTMLNALHSAGIIASRSWSLFWGLTGADARSQMDGSLVLGGYDAAKVTGDNFTDHLYIDKGCITSLLVTVTDIVMNLPNGSRYSILGTSSGAAMRMCISPDFPLITLPADVWSAFSDHSGGTSIGRSLGINGYGMVYAAQDVYAGSLTFSLSSGLKITIPNSQLVVPDLSINNQGTTIADGSTREIMLNGLQGINGNDLPVLGQTFLTSAYLMVNQDAGTFTLWQSQATLNQSLVGIGTSKTCAAPTISSGTLPNLPSSASSNASNPNPNPNPNPPGPSHLSGGTIAGTCVGAVVICALVLGVILWLMRRSRRREEISRADGSSFPQMPVPDMPELPHDNHKPQELPWRSTMQEAPQRYPNELAA